MKPSENNRHRKQKILLVDDEEDILYILGRDLERRGFEVDSFSSSVQALQMFKPGAYDLAILDIRMPGLTGIQLYRELRKCDPAIIPAFLSAFEIHPNEFEKVFPSIGSQVKTIIKKPVAVDALLREITPLLNLSSMTRASTGDHIFAVFPTPEKLVEQSLWFLKIGLIENDEDILLVTDQLSTGAIRQRIDKEWSVDAASLESEGRITLTTFSEWHLTDGKFDAKRSKAQLANMAKNSKKKGRSGIRSVNDANSFLARRMFKELTAWELLLGKRFSLPVTTMCTYTNGSISQLDSELSLTIEQNHSVAIET